MNEKQTPLERAMRQQSEKLVESFFIIGAVVSNNFFPDSRQELLYKYPADCNVSDKVISFLKSPTPFERISVKKYLEIERMHAAVTILPGSGVSQFAVIVSHLEPVCLHSSLMSGPIILPSTIASFNAVRRFYVFICLQPHVLGLVEALKLFIQFDFDAKLAMLSSSRHPQHQLKKEELEEMLSTLMTSYAPNLSYSIPQIPTHTTNFKGYTLVLSHHIKDNKTTKKCLHPLTIRYTSLYPLPNLMLLCDFSLPYLFTLLPLDTILNIFSEIILETSVLFTSTKPTSFTSCCVFLPLIPQSHLEILDVPVPGIFGTQPLSQKPLNSGLLVNNQTPSKQTPSKQTPSKQTTSKQTPLKQTQPKQTTKLPLSLEENLRAALENVIESWKGEIRKNCCDFSTEVMNVFWISFYMKLFSIILGFEEEDIGQLKNRIKESNVLDEQMIEFLIRFIQTQHFNTWWYSQYLENKEKISQAVFGE
ncbi:UDENN domain-containing protein [Entamoeba marina]